jgi:hypothetical protein
MKLKTKMAWTYRVCLPCEKCEESYGRSLLSYQKVVIMFEFGDQDRARAADAFDGKLPGTVVEEEMEIVKGRRASSGKEYWELRREGERV